VSGRLARAGLLIAGLALACAAGSSASVRPRKHNAARRERSTASEVVVPRGQPVEIAFANDPGIGFASDLANAVQMAVDAEPDVRGFPVRVNVVNAATCGNPPTAAAAAVGAANAITADRQNVAVLGQVCSFGFAQALPIYESAGVVTITGSATSPSLPAAAPTVFDRTTVDDTSFDTWYATVSTLPSDLAWRQAYSRRFGTAPSEFADLYYDAATLLIRDLQRVSRIDSLHNLVVSREDLATMVRSTTGFQGVSCTVTIDASTGNRIDDPIALAKCA